MVIRHLYLLLALCAGLLPLAVEASGPSTHVSQVWIRQAPPGVDVMAGYFTLENLTAKPLQLTSVTSPDFGSVMIHESVQQGTHENMVEVTNLSIPAHGRIEFKPGGYHLMLVHPNKYLYAGDMVSLILSFSDGSQLAILAYVRRDPPTG